MRKTVRRVLWGSIQGLLILGFARPVVAQTCPLPNTLDFDSLPTPAADCADATSLLVGVGITFTTANPGAVPLICPTTASTAVVPVSLPNFFFVNPVVGHSNEPLTYTLHFCTPLSSFTFFRAAQVSGTTGPAWTATAFDAHGQVVGTPVGEPNVTSDPPAQQFTITGEGIVSVTVAADNGGSASANNPALDNFAFTRVADCEVEVSAPTYTTGDTVVLSSLHIANHLTRPLAIELKIWLGVPGPSPLSLANLGANGFLVLPAGFDNTSGPTPLFPVTPGVPRGAYEIGCRILDPVTGARLGDGIAPFTIQ